MTEIELNTRVCVECKKTFRTPGQEQLCPSCRERHKRESLKKEAEDSKKIPIVDAPKKEKPKVSLDEEQRIEKIYNAVHTSRYHGYVEIVSIIESRKGTFVCAVVRKSPKAEWFALPAKALPIPQEGGDAIWQSIIHHGNQYVRSISTRADKSYTAKEL